jgi:hypothetical protein
MLGSVNQFAISHLGLGFYINALRLIVKGVIRNYQKNLDLASNLAQNQRSMYLWTWWDSYRDRFSAMDKMKGERGKMPPITSNLCQNHHTTRCSPY